MIQLGETVRIGEIKIASLSAVHSAEGVLMFLLEGGGKRLLYTGDFRRGGSELENLPYIDVLLCEGTNIDLPIGLCEQEIEERSAQIMAATDKPVFVLCSSTNGQRIRSIQAACQHSKRTLTLDPFGKEILECMGFPLSEWVGFVLYCIKDKRTHKYLRLGFISSDVIARRSGLTFMVRATMGGFLKRLDRKFSLNSSVLRYSLWRSYEIACGIYISIAGMLLDEEKLPYTFD